MKILDIIGRAQMNAVTEQREIPEFGPGDTLKINVKVVEGSRERVQAFEGVCIGRSNRGINSSFTVRKISTTWSHSDAEWIKYSCEVSIERARVSMCRTELTMRAASLRFSM